MHRHGARTASRRRFAELSEQTTAWVCDRSLATVEEYRYGMDREHALYRLLFTPGRQSLAGTCYAGQLTAVGHAQMRQLGEHLRRLYVEQLDVFGAHRRRQVAARGLASPLREHQLVYVRTTNIRRAVESVYALLVGFLPSSNRRVTGEPAIITVHTTEERMETMYWNTPGCPQLDALSAEARRILGAEYARCDQEAADARADVAKTLGLPPDALPSAHGILDEAMARLAQGLSLPAGITDTQLRRLERAVRERFFFGLHEFPVLVRLRIGRFVGDLLHRMNAVVGMAASDAATAGASTPDDISAVSIFSGHDTTIVPLLYALGIEDSTWPPFAANVVFELFRERAAPTQHYIRVLYNGVPARLRGCSRAAHVPSDGSLYEYAGFAAAMARFVPTDWPRECREATLDAPNA